MSIMSERLAIFDGKLAVITTSSSGLDETLTPIEGPVAVYVEKIVVDLEDTVFSDLGKEENGVHTVKIDNGKIGEFRTVYIAK